MLFFLHLCKHHVFNNPIRIFSLFIELRENATDSLARTLKMNLPFKNQNVRNMSTVIRQLFQCPGATKKKNQRTC